MSSIGHSNKDFFCEFLPALDSRLKVVVVVSSCTHLYARFPALVVFIQKSYSTDHQYMPVAFYRSDDEHC